MNIVEYLNQFVAIFDFPDDERREVVADLTDFISQQAIERMANDPSTKELIAQLQQNDEAAIQSILAHPTAQQHYADSMFSVLTDWTLYMSTRVSNEVREKAKKSLRQTQAATSSSQ